MLLSIIDKINQAKKKNQQRCKTLNTWLMTESAQQSNSKRTECLVNIVASEYPYRKKSERDFSFLTRSKGIKVKTIKILKGNIGKNLHDVKLG